MKIVAGEVKTVRKMKQALVLVCGVSPGVVEELIVVVEAGKASMRFTTFITVRVQLSSNGG